MGPREVHFYYLSFLGCMSSNVLSVQGAFCFKESHDQTTASSSSALIYPLESGLI